MALIKCPECGKENVSDSAIACPNCGFAIKEYYEKEKKLKIDDNRKRAFHKKSKAIIICFVVVLLSSLVLFTLNLYHSSKLYKLRLIEKSISSGEYNEAREMALSLNDKCLLAEITYKAGLGDFEAENYINAYEKFITISDEDIKESKTIDRAKLEDYILQCKINIANYGKYLFDNREYDEAYRYFSISYKGFSDDANPDYNKHYFNEKTSVDALMNLKKIGDFESEDGRFRISFIDDRVNIETYKGSATTTYILGYTHIEFDDVDGRFSLEKTSISDPNSGYMFLSKDLGGPEDCFPVSELQSKTPQLGMSASELENTEWGKPEKINTTTYTWGVTEQWCYSGNRYVYLENGVVTAISDSN